MEIGFILILVGIYFLPAIIAFNRYHQSAVPIIFLNILLGWTLIGWIVAFIWSVTSPSEVVIKNQTTQSTADEIQKLANLKEQGLLTEDEFNREKQQILSNE